MNIGPAINGVGLFLPVARGVLKVGVCPEAWPIVVGRLVHPDFEFRLGVFRQIGVVAIPGLWLAIWLGSVFVFGTIVILGRHVTNQGPLVLNTIEGPGPIILILILALGLKHY